MWRPNLEKAFSKKDFFVLLKCPVVEELMFYRKKKKMSLVRKKFLEPKCTHVNVHMHPKV